MSCGANEQIRVAYEDNGMSPDEIADDLGFEVTAVKASLMTHSRVYRQNCGQEPEAIDTLNFSDDQMRQVNDVIFGLATGAEDERLRFDAARYVRDDKKGRKDVNKNLSNAMGNLLVFNQLVQQSRLKAAAAKQIVVDTTAEIVKPAATVKPTDLVHAAEVEG